MPRWVVLVEHAVEADTSDAAIAGLTAAEHGEAPTHVGWAVRGVRAADETAEGGGGADRACGGG